MRSRMASAKVAPAARLVELIERHGLGFGDLAVADLGEGIVLKEAKRDYWHTPTGIDYDDNRTTRRYRRELQQINAWLRRADLSLAERFPGELRHIDLSDR